MSTISLRHGDRQDTARIDGERVTVGEVTFTVEPIGEGVYRVTSDSGQHTVAVAGPADQPWVFVEGVAAQLEIEAGGRPRAARRIGSHDLTSPMPATVIRVVVEPGAAVAKGDTLLVLEAMKMELPIRAPADGVVKAVHCAAGDLVQPGVPLLELE